LVNPEPKHTCLPLQLTHDQQFRNSSNKIIIKEIPGKIESLLYREKEMGKLIQKIMEGQRLVFVFGLFGIGKSWIARNVLHYLKERKYFCGGLIFLPLNGTRTVDALCHQLYGLLVKNIVVTQDNREFLQNLMDSKSDSINFFVDFFNNNTNFTMKRSLRYPGRNLFKNDSAKKYLICLDNAEDLIDAKKEEFRALLKKLLS